ncbi:hypothetical protein KFU94_05110 [Chloroflexi bacterium TSY]|nr:hypothetical protein [Chloroflexi bacterium TSY]
MEITREILAAKLSDYLHQLITLADLVDWAEWAMMDGDFDEEDFDEIRSVVARLGIADVRTFGISWQDYTEMLSQLGYKAQVQIVPA